MLYSKTEEEVEMHIPSHLEAYKRTAVFTQESVPQGLLKTHTTAPGAWARIVVKQGRLLFTRLGGRPHQEELSPEKDGWIEPENPHFLTCEGPVRFYLEFYRKRRI